MRRLYFIAFLCVLLGCKKTEQKDLHYLNGYWEIEKVTLKDGSDKEYTVNAIVDLIQIEGLKGYRKKVRPGLDGSFIANNDAELFTVSTNNDLLVMHYKTELSMWSEEILTLSPDRFTVRNEDGIVYSYKRFQPFNISK